MPPIKADARSAGSEDPVFLMALQRTLTLEGDFVHDPDDPGGATRFGITQRVARRNGYQGDMQALPLDIARAIYWQDYWVPAGCPELPPIIASPQFDAAVNTGVGTAIKMLQAAVNVHQDGIIGPTTRAAIQAYLPLHVTVRMLAQREYHYTTLPGWKRYGKGWSRRVVSHLRHAINDAAALSPA